MNVNKRKPHTSVSPLSTSSKKKRLDGTEESFQGGSSDVTPSGATLNQTPTTPQPVLKLLDFSSLVDESEILYRFDQIARVLLHDFYLVVQGKQLKTEFEILELEFYLQKKACHEDPFTHGSEEQKICGNWYFHRAPRRSEDSLRSSTSLSGYRGGTRKGLDLTLGGPAPNIVSPYFASSDTSKSTKSPGVPPDNHLLRGGILLRSIKRVDTQSKVISGPSLLVDEVLRLSDATSIKDLVELKWHNMNAFTPPLNAKVPKPDSRISLSLVSRANVNNSSLQRPTIYQSPRIGLDLTHPGIKIPDDHSSPLHPRIVFVAKPYRYFTHPGQLVANGRPQTFIGVLNSLIDSSSSPNLESKSDQSRLVQDISRVTGMKAQGVVQYLEYYNAGKVGGLELMKTFIGSNGKGASKSPATYLKMMGSLESVFATKK